MSSFFSFESTGASSYDVSYQIDWHSNALLATQGTSVQVEGVAQTFGTDYTFNETTRYIEFTVPPSVGQTISIQRTTPSEFYTQASPLGAAPASVMLSNDEQLMKRIEEVEATGGGGSSSNLTGGATVTYLGNPVASIEVSDSLIALYDPTINQLDLGVTVAQYNGANITEIELGSNLTQSTFTNGVLRLIADVTTQGGGTVVTSVNSNTGDVVLGASDVGAVSTTDFNTYVNTTAPASFAAPADLADKVTQTDINTSLNNYDTSSEVDGKITAKVGDALIGYAVKDIVGGTGITATNVSGTVTVTSDAAAAAAPTGSMTMWCGDSAQPPPGWLVCDGTLYDAVSDPTKQGLFDVIGIAFSGDLASPGNSNFRVPDMRDKFPFGATVDSGRGDENVRESVTLSTSNLPSHTHSVANLSVESHKHDDGSLYVLNHNHEVDLQTDNHTHQAGGNLEGTITIPTERASGSSTNYTGTRLQRGSGSTASTITSTYMNTTYTVSFDGFVGANGGIPVRGDTENSTAGIGGDTGLAAPDIEGSLGTTGNNLAFPITPSYVGIHFIIKT